MKMAAAAAISPTQSTQPGGSKSTSPKTSPNQSGCNNKIGSKSTTSNVKKLPKVNVNPAIFKRRIDNEQRYFVNHSKDAATLYKLVSIDAEHRRWNILFLPNNQPYNVGAYRLVVDFPVEYPFRPPMLQFLTKIYHPNIGEKGNIEIGLCNVETWKPTIRIHQLCDLISSMLNYPQPINAVRKDIAEQMIKNCDAFYKEALNFAKNHSEVRA